MQMYCGLWKNTEHSTASAYCSSSVLVRGSGAGAVSLSTDVATSDKELGESMEEVLRRVTASRRATRWASSRTQSIARLTRTAYRDDRRLTVTMQMMLLSSVHSSWSTAKKATKVVVQSSNRTPAATR